MAGSDGLLRSVSGWAVGCALFLPWFALRGMGAGDVKLLAAFGAWIGPWTIVWAAAYAAIAGGLLAVAVALRRRYFKVMMRNLSALLTFWRIEGVRPHPGLTLATAPGPRLPYAFPITAGALAALWLG
jgi:prepilin peptidase CpaA